MRRLRLLMALLVSLVLVLPVAMPAAADEYPVAYVSIDGKVLAKSGYIINGRTMMPMRAIFEALGATIEWDGATRSVTGTKGTVVVKLTIDSTTGKIGSKDYTLSVPPLIINGSTYVPVRFLIDALGLKVDWDQANVTAKIATDAGCTIAGGQKHSGIIAPGGETWGLCGSPHIIEGEFVIEGKDNPVLTIEAGTLVQFESGANFRIGREAPGGLWVKGTASSPVTLTSAIAGAQPGSWKGLHFYDQTMRDMATIENARIEYAGAAGVYNGAVYAEGNQNLVELTLKNVEIKNSLFSGVYLWGNSRLSARSGDLKISGTKQSEGRGGFPIVTGTVGSHLLPNGIFKDNDVNAVNIAAEVSGTIGTNTTWRNIGIPYAISKTLTVGGSSSPSLTINRGAITLWAQDSGLYVGTEGPGSLVADATAKPEGGGEWHARLDGGGEWLNTPSDTFQFTPAGSDWLPTLKEALKGANAKASIEPGCALCGASPAIVFGSWNASPARGDWNGINLGGQAGIKSRIVGAVVAYAGKDAEYSAGIYGDNSSGSQVKFLLAKSLITGSARSGLEFWGTVEPLPGSMGNHFVGNGWPVRLAPNQIGLLEKGNVFTGNDSDWISVRSQADAVVSKSATWRELGVPYYFETAVFIGGTARPVVTIEPGAKLMFKQDTALDIGAEEVGSLIAVGTAAKPIVFTSPLGRPGSWTGLRFGANAGAGNRLEQARIEFAVNGVELAADLGPFLKSTTIKGSSGTGVWRGYDLGGTNLLTGLGNQFEGNALDTNE